MKFQLALGYLFRCTENRISECELLSLTMNMLPVWCRCAYGSGAATSRSGSPVGLGGGGGGYVGAPSFHTTRSISSSSRTSSSPSSPCICKTACYETYYLNVAWIDLNYLLLVEFSVCAVPAWVDNAALSYWITALLSC